MLLILASIRSSLGGLCVSAYHYLDTCQHLRLEASVIYFLFFLYMDIYACVCSDLGRTLHTCKWASGERLLQLRNLSRLIGGFFAAC